MTKLPAGCHLQIVKGKTILPFVPALAELRISIFKEYPYLYDGDFAYEKAYLERYTRCDDALVVLILDGNTLVGASTAIPMEFAACEFQQPFVGYAIALPKIFYLGESVLQRAYRGRGIYRSFFQAREQAAKDYGCVLTTFCAVERLEQHPKKPQNYMALDKIWQRIGYTKQPNLITHFEWKEVDVSTPSQQPMIFWTKHL